MPKADSVEKVPVSRYEAYWAAMTASGRFQSGPLKVGTYGTSMFSTPNDDGGKDPLVNILLTAFIEYGIHLVINPKDMMDMMLVYITPNEAFTAPTADLRQLPKDFTMMVINMVGADVLGEFLRKAMSEHESNTK